MFELKYKIFNNCDTEEGELIGKDGYFEITVDNEIYGIFIPEEIDEFSVYIYWWFTYFLEALELLENHNYVLISDIEKPKIWIEIKKISNEMISFSKVNADKPEGTYAVEVKKMPNLSYPYWKNKIVVFENFKHEVLMKAEQYVNELTQLNSSNHSDVIKLESLIEKVKKNKKGA